LGVGKEEEVVLTGCPCGGGVGGGGGGFGGFGGTFESGKRGDVERGVFCWRGQEVVDTVFVRMGGGDCGC
jgi:hypothetical protein